jgi:hypothetical protein
MISAQTRSAFVASENRYTFFAIMLWPQKRGGRREASAPFVLAFSCFCLLVFELAHFVTKFTW